jgi:D-alanine transaminase
MHDELTLACLNGELMPADEARVPIWDRGFLFGDAVYEVYRLYQGRPWLEAAHSARLERSLRELELPAVDMEALRHRIGRTIAASGVREGIVYIQITRGVAPRKHAFPPAGTPPTELIVVKPYDDGPTARLRRSGVGVLSRPDWRWARCDIKSTNLLANCLANEAAHRADAYEAVLVDRDGLVTEATHSSVLWVRNGVLGGTPEGNIILPGTTRGRVLELAARHGIPFEPGRVTLEELARADEVMLVGTTIEVLPVVQMDGQPIASGAPGPVAKALGAAFTENVAAWLATG